MNTDNMVVSEKGMFYNVILHREDDKLALSMNRRCLCYPGTSSRSWTWRWVLRVDRVLSMIVSHVSSTDPCMNVISVNDIIVAVNGISICSFPDSLSKQDWFTRYNSVNFPRLLCFFHCDPNGTDVLIPSKVRVLISLERRSCMASLLFTEVVSTVLHHRAIS